MRSITKPLSSGYGWNWRRWYGTSPMWIEHTDLDVPNGIASNVVALGRLEPPRLGGGQHWSIEPVDAAKHAAFFGGAIARDEALNDEHEFAGPRLHRAEVGPFGRICIRIEIGPRGSVCTAVGDDTVAPRPVTPAQGSLLLGLRRIHFCSRAAARAGQNSCRGGGDPTHDSCSHRLIFSRTRELRSYWRASHRTHKRAHSTSTRHWAAPKSTGRAGCRVGQPAGRRRRHRSFGAPTRRRSPCWKHRRRGGCAVRKHWP